MNYGEFINELVTLTRMRRTLNDCEEALYALQRNQPSNIRVTSEAAFREVILTTAAYEAAHIRSEQDIRTRRAEMNFQAAQIITSWPLPTGLDAEFKVDGSLCSAFMDSSNELAVQDKINTYRFTANNISKPQSNPQEALALNTVQS